MGRVRKSLRKRKLINAKKKKSNSDRSKKTIKEKERLRKKITREKFKENFTLYFMMQRLKKNLPKERKEDMPK